MNTNQQRYPGWAGVCSFDPDTEPVEVHEVHADVLPDEVVAILALTPHVAEDTDWRTREEEARRLNELAAKEFAASWDIFVEKQIHYEDDGDVLFA